MASPSSLTTEEILFQLHKLIQGLYYQSEADYPLEVVSIDGPPTNELTQETILNITGKTATEPIEVTESISFFRHLAQVNPGTEQKANAPTSPQALQNFLEQFLLDLKVYRIGRRTLTGLLVGKTANGSWLGIKTTIIET
ncbi:MAG: nuclease A inhibitor family protein [Bacteroidota bacterium]|nr:nuclease A inhibitor family protein [Bacteroidota bacterium]